MTPIEENILEEYSRQKKDFLDLNDIVYEKIYTGLKTQGLRVLSISSRVKTAISLKGKLEKHSGKYKSLDSLTDILGVRIITFFSDEVDRAGNIISNLFDVDWENSIDKRSMIKEREFGYLSLHYVCSLKKEEGFSENYTSKKFEIQIRTGLQHIWAEIEHDIGYKGEKSTAKATCRRFAQLAGLLEIADREFIEIRDTMKNYAREIQYKVVMNQLEDIEINSVSLSEYISGNKNIKKLLDSILKIEGAECVNANTDHFIEKLEFFGISTLEQLDCMVRNNSMLAYKIAEKNLRGLSLDILSSTIALRNVCLAELAAGNYSDLKLMDFFKLETQSEEYIHLEVEKLKEYRKLI